MKPLKIQQWTANGQSLAIGLHAQPRVIVGHKPEVEKLNKLQEMEVEGVQVPHLKPELATDKNVLYLQQLPLQQPGEKNIIKSKSKK